MTNANEPLVSQGISMIMTTMAITSTILFSVLFAAGTSRCAAESVGVLGARIIPLIQANEGSFEYGLEAPDSWHVLRISRQLMRSRLAAE